MHRPLNAESLFGAHESGGVREKVTFHSSVVLCGLALDRHKLKMGASILLLTTHKDHF
jgi:hypothetical protein